MELSEGEQMELMNLIQERSLVAMDVEAGGERADELERSRIDELYFKIQSLYTENVSLTGELEAQGDEITKLK